MSRDDDLTSSANDDPAQPRVAASVDPRDVLRHVARARALQSAVMAAHARGLIGAVARAAAATARAAKRWHAARVTRRELDHLSDDILKDIGIDRYSIPKVVDGLLAGLDPRVVSAEVLVHRAAGARAGDRRDVARPSRDLAA
ncbi:MAG: DUF1127 domain-containing protein [Gammaproteobacteria bacterium]|nr:DUF1127 domain-containing protein [Gammaproteobacteria bacterium]